MLYIRYYKENTERMLLHAEHVLSWIRSRQKATSSKVQEGQAFEVEFRLGCRGTRDGVILTENMNMCLPRRIFALTLANRRPTTSGGCKSDLFSSQPIAPAASFTTISPKAC